PGKRGEREGDDHRDAHLGSADEAGGDGARGAEALGGVDTLFRVEDVVREVGADLDPDGAEQRGERRTDPQGADRVRARGADGHRNDGRGEGGGPSGEDPALHAALRSASSSAARTAPGRSTRRLWPAPGTRRAHGRAAADELWSSSPTNTVTGTRTFAGS